MLAPDFTPKSFDAFWKLGYVRLVPIIPPDAPISENSSLYKRVGTPQDSRGKSVGIKGRDDKWYGFDWIPYEADQGDLERWTLMAAGIGVKLGRTVWNGEVSYLIAVDADTLNEDWARIIRDLIEEHIGRLPVRIGKYPKCLYLLRITEPMPYTRVEFGNFENGRLTDRVEILSEGRQFVASGIHPGTKQPYTWMRPLPALVDLPAVHPSRVLGLLEAIRAAMPAAKPLITEGSTSDVDQATLTGKLEDIKAAVSATPNTSAQFGTRESYRDFGYAIKAALPDHPAEAFEIFNDWCARWTDGENDPGVVEADWRRMKPPYRRGASWLYELAEQHGGGQFDRANIWFDKIDDQTEIPDYKSLQKPLTAQGPIRWIDPAEWHAATIPERKFQIAGMIPDGEVTLLTGAGGVGKTLLAQMAGTCVSLGLPFLGRETVQGKVMMFLCEDSEDELHLRQRDINTALCRDMVDVSPHLRIASRKYMDNLLVLWDRNTGALKRQAVWQQLRDDAVSFGAKLLIVDTIADTFGGSEIDRSQVRQFIQSCLGKLAQEIGGAVLALGHPSKAGQSTGDGTSGSTAWHASVRSRLYLTHATKDGSGPFRRLQNMKANYGQAGDVFMLRWSRGAFELVSSKTGAGQGEAGAFGHTAPAIGDVIDAAILVAVEELAAGGSPLSGARNSSYYAPKVLRARFDEMLGMYSADDIEAGWQRALDAGRVREATVGYKQNRHPIMGYRTAEKPDSLSDDVFD